MVSTGQLTSHVFHNLVDETITVYTGDYSWGITIQDRNL